MSTIILVTANHYGDPPEARQIAQYTFHVSSAAPTPGLSRWQDYRLHALVLLVLACALVAGHW